MAVQPLASQVGVAPACRALGVPRASFYRRQRPAPGHQQPRPTPARALCASERAHVLDVLASPRFVDRSPAEVVATLLDEGQYLCAERTMYRILAANQPVRERRNQRSHPCYTKPELVATGPNQTWSWDITRLRGPKRWTSFYLYVLLDIFSRCVQICTMREVGSDTERRQQVGRGVRLPVNQEGERIQDERINVLTVVASETYERFVAGLQSEIEAEYGKDGTPPPPPDARKKTTLRLRKAHTLKPEFKELWDRIRYKTRYAVTIDSHRLVEDVLPGLDGAAIRKPRVSISKAEVIANDKDTFEALTQSGARTAIDLAGRYPLPNLVKIMENLMENTSPPMRVSRRTLLEIFRRTGNRAAALDNPHEFATVAIGIVKSKLADQLVEGIRYEKLDKWYEMTLFDSEIETWADYIVPSTERNGAGGTHIYDGVPFDSETIEKPFIEALERRKDVKLYVKLPSWFTVATPIGAYNPDWAIVMENPDGSDLLYLIRETKGTLDLDALRPDEKRKILCGRKHFRDTLEMGQRGYRVVTETSQLPDGGV